MVKQYLELVNEPWGQIFYDLLNVQLELEHTKNLKILDFGSGFGKTANSFAEHNQVTAIETNEEMILNRFTSNNYEQITSDESILNELPQNYYDLIICHNVLEYVNNYEEVCSLFQKLIKKDGIISIIKHNFSGTILHNGVLLDNPEQALKLFNSNENSSKVFGKINYYSTDELIDYFKKNDCTLIEKMGIRSIYGLSSNNSIKYDPHWYEKMKELELLLSKKSEFVEIAFFHHLLFKKV